MYEQTMQFISKQMEELTINESREENTIQSQTDTNTVTQNEEANENLLQESNGVGGAELENVVMEEPIALNDTAQEQIPETDEQYLKNNFSFIKPIEGVVSSEFGQRESSNPIVSTNHTGIDIAANTGTVVKAAMEGTVTISSTVGDYGYHIKITNNDVSTLYAHCSKLYVKEGDTISQGQEIAEVGSTGKSTGPHLHFEIMRGSTYINPRSILEF
ncbi:MAG: M23 family metallopeptidase [Clostridia bacterium]|nr:M23 family metallopeptidase [Clostridia bacterium]